jgi:hypothetical protein
VQHREEDRIMAKNKTRYGAVTRIVGLAPQANWPRKVPAQAWWQDLARRIRKFKPGRQMAAGLPFSFPARKDGRVVLLAKGRPDITLPIGGRADYVCFVHEWAQIPETITWGQPREGLAVGEYRLLYADGTQHRQRVRARFEVAMAECHGPSWLTAPFYNWETTAPDGVPVPAGMQWGVAQHGLNFARCKPAPLVYALENPHPEKTIRALALRGAEESPLLIYGVTLYSGAAHPLRSLPRRTYALNLRKGGRARVAQAKVDLGTVVRIQRTNGRRNARWLASPELGLNKTEDKTARFSSPKGEDLLELHGAPDATVAVKLEGERKPLAFSLGEAFHGGASRRASVTLKVLGKRRQWMQVRVIDGSTGQPTPVRIHFSGSRGEYIAPYGHHEHVNALWFEDYGADVVVHDRQFAYVHGEFSTELPVGDLYVEMFKGFEYAPVRAKVRVRPGQATLELRIERWKDLRREGWVTADTHVHFISPHTAWLEAQAEGVNVVNLLASQWGRLFTNVGDIIGRPNIVENDTIVYVGTENRNHMLGHMSMLGTQGLPVYPMCTGGPGEAWVGDPDLVSLAEWALENKRKGGVVIRPHFPFCGNTEDPVPIVKGLVDALELSYWGEPLRDFATQEWYRYLNCGYKVAVCAGTDKMGAYCPLGWVRTYARLDPGRPLGYDAWAEAVRAGRTISTNGPLLDLQVDGRPIGDTIQMGPAGGTLEIRALAECFWPLTVFEVVFNGQVVKRVEDPQGARMLAMQDKFVVPRSGWLAARCRGVENHPAAMRCAHTSPVYVRCGDTRAFDGPAARHMLNLVQGATEYINTIATTCDEASRKRLVKLFKEVQAELKGRFVVEAPHAHEPGD